MLGQTRLACYYFGFDIRRTIYKVFCERIFKTTGVSRRTSETNVQTQLLSAIINNFPFISNFHFVFRRLHFRQNERQPPDSAESRRRDAGADARTNQSVRQSQFDAGEDGLEIRG